jgi:integrase
MCTPLEAINGNIYPMPNPYEIVSGRHAPATRKQVLALIKRVYNWAINRELYFGPNPATKIKAPKVNNQVTECLTKAELDLLLRVLDSWVNKRAALIVRFALYTGFRLDEVIGLNGRLLETRLLKTRLNSLSIMPM